MSILDKVHAAPASAKAAFNEGAESAQHLVSSIGESVTGAVSEAVQPMASVTSAIGERVSESKRSAGRQGKKLRGLAATALPPARGRGRQRRAHRVAPAPEAARLLTETLAPVAATTAGLGAQIAVGKAAALRRTKKAREALEARQKEAASELARRQERLARRVKAERTRGADKKSKRAKKLRRRRKDAEKAVHKQEEKLRRLAAAVPARLAGTKREASVPIGIDRLLRDVETGRFEKTMSALTAVGAAITAIEIWSEHDGASFGNKMMWLPVVIIPTAVPLGIASVFSRRVAKTLLPVFSAVIVANGVQGMYFHWRGIAQKPGGLRKNFRYNVEMGPPALAPLLASVVGGMGLLASVLRREDEPV